MTHQNSFWFETYCISKKRKQAGSYIQLVVVWCVEDIFQSKSILASSWKKVFAQPRPQHFFENFFPFPETPYWGVYGSQKRPQICLTRPTEPKTSETEDFFGGRGGMEKVLSFLSLQFNKFFKLLEIMRKHIRDTSISRRPGALSCLERANSITNYRIGSFLIIAGRRFHIRLGYLWFWWKLLFLWIFFMRERMMGLCIALILWPRIFLLDMKTWLFGCAFTFIIRRGATGWKRRWSM